MSKKEQNQPVQPAVPNPAPQAPVQVTEQPDNSRKYFVIFWCVILVAASAAWAMGVYLPGVSESLVERWVMAALAVSLAVFLFFYK